MQVLKTALGLVAHTIFLIFLIRVYSRICENLGIFKLLNKLWGKIGKIIYK